MPHRSPQRVLLAEAFGTFMIVLVGTGAIVLALPHEVISLAFGLIVFAMICAVGKISGAHMNPAVTIGFMLARRFPRHLVIPYILSQCAGAMLASLLLLSLFPAHATLGATLPSAGVAQAFVIEWGLTFLLMFVILSVSKGTKEKGLMPAVVIGAVVGLEAFFGGPFTGASMNPARSLAPAVASGNLESLWLYLVATTLGAVTAVFMCKCIHRRDCCGGFAAGCA